MNTIERFLIWRRRNGLSQTAAGRLMGVSRDTVVRIERGQVSAFRWLLEENLPVTMTPAEELWLMRWQAGLTVYHAAAAIDVPEYLLRELEHGRKPLNGIELSCVEAVYRSAANISL